MKVNVFHLFLMVLLIIEFLRKKLYMLGTCNKGITKSSFLAVVNPSRVDAEGESESYQYFYDFCRNIQMVIKIIRIWEGRIECNDGKNNGVIANLQYKVYTVLLIV